MRALTICAMLSLAAVACESGEPTQDLAQGTSAQAAPVAAKTTAEVMDECPGEQHDSCGSAAPAEEGQRAFGTFALSESAPLSEVAASASEEEKTVQVTGTVDSVCQKKGCWMVLKDGDVTARVFTHAGDFFLPKDTEKGRAAVVEGKLEARTVSEKFAKHLAEDQGKDPSTVTGPQKELIINATAIALK